MFRKIRCLTKYIDRSTSSSFLRSDNSLYLEQMYQSYLNDKNSVSNSLQIFFDNLDNGIDPEEAYQDPLQFTQNKFSIKMPSLNKNQQSKVLQQVLEMQKFYQQYGHYYADTDPLHLTVGKEHFEETKFIEKEREFIDKEFLDIELEFDFPFKSDKVRTPRQLQEKLKQIYCGQISYEFVDITDMAQIEYIKQKVETMNEPYSKEEKLDLLDRLMETTLFSKYCEIKFQTQKRFGVEGLDSGISGMMGMIKTCADKDIKEVILGMAHRGRLNTLTCVFKKPYRNLLGEFEGVKPKKDHQNITNFLGDVKYHQGTAREIEINGKKMHLSLLPNPSHLEIINPLVMGSAKARQLYHGDKTGRYVLPILAHGDAAVSGQGVNYEIQQFESIKDFQVGGTIHIVFNNQIGFTTDQDRGRTNYHCTSLAKINQSFVIHVNADNPELVDKSLKLAVDFRNKFQKDVYIDIIGYRRRGHNEQDLPDFTQPIMYQKISQIKPIDEQYCQQLIKEGVITQKEIDQIEKKYMDKFKKEHEEALNSNYEIYSGDYYNQTDEIKQLDTTTGYDLKQLQDIGIKAFNIPKEFNQHKKIKEQYDQYYNSIKDGKDIKFYMAESLAYMTLAKEGFNVRAVGQDFAHGFMGLRNIFLRDQQNGDKLIPIQQGLSKEEYNRITQVDSPASELGVLGFEYGFSLADLKNFDQWEVQLSEFLNNTAMVLDQFITTSEKKWARTSGILLTIPYSLDLNSLCNKYTYMERLLSNVSDDYFYYAEHKDQRNDLESIENYLVYNVTTPANYFHALRGQCKRKYRKPLFLYYSKKTIQDSGSQLEDFQEDKSFEKVISSEVKDQQKLKKVVFVSGSFCYDILNKINDKNLQDSIQVVRLEQTAPFPYNEVNEVVKNVNKDCDIIFAQEEPFNYGAFSYIEPRLNVILKENDLKEVQYIGKDVSAVSGSISTQKNQKEFEKILDTICD